MTLAAAQVYVFGYLVQNSKGIHKQEDVIGEHERKHRIDHEKKEASNPRRNKHHPIILPQSQRIVRQCVNQCLEFVRRSFKVAVRKILVKQLVVFLVSL